MARFLLSLLGLAGLVLHAQPGALRFQHLTVEDGLTDNAITCLFEDRAGHIWVGTERGLNRYDGNRVEHFGDRDPQLDNDHITAITEDSKGIFWIATQGAGLVRLDLSQRDFRRFRSDAKDPRSIASERLNCLFDLNDTTLMIGAEQVPIIFLDKRTLAFSYWRDSTSIAPSRATSGVAIASGWCHTIVPVDDHRLWIGLLNYNRSLMADRRTGAVLNVLVSQRDGSQTLTTACAMNGQLYAGGWQNGIDRFTMGRWTDRSVIDLPDEVRGIVTWDDHTLMIATRQLGLDLYDAATDAHTWVRHARSDPSSLASDHVNCVFKDRAGDLWVGTADGLDVFAPSVWRMRISALPVEEDQADPLFFKLEQEKEDGIRIFSSEGFFVRPHPGSRIEGRPVVFHGIPFQPTTAVSTERDTFLLGTETGVLLYDRRNERATSFYNVNDALDPALHPGNMFQIRGLFTDRLGNEDVLLAGVLGFGLWSIPSTTPLSHILAPLKDQTDQQPWSMVRDVVRDRQGTYWVATAAGVIQWDPPRGAQVARTTYWTSGTGATGGLPPGEVRDLLFTSDTLWVATMDGGLGAIIGGRARAFEPPPSASKRIHAITADRAGRIWCTTDDGLLRFDPIERSWLRVPVNDGSRFRKLSRAITSLSDGRIAFCASNSLIEFDPRDFDRLPSLPLPFLVATHSAGKALEVDEDRASLSYRSSVIEISLSALRPVAPRPVEFLYRLEGVEQDWQVTAAREPIRYAGVPVGTHRLLVRVRDAYGRTGPEHVLLTVAVSGPIWQRWWFYAIIALLVSASVYAWSRFRLEQALKLQAVRNRIASDLHDEVGSSLSSITIGSQLATQLSSKENAQVKQLMARIGETSSASLRSMSDIVWAIDPKNDEGEALVKRMRRIANELLESKGIEVSFSVSGGVQDLKLPMIARKEIVLIFKEAVHNVSKYADANVVQVSLHRRNGALTMSVKDDGKGFDVALHPDGHGLGNMHRRAKALGGTLTLTSAPGMGTLVGVEVDLTRIRD